MRNDRTDTAIYGAAHIMMNSPDFGSGAQAQARHLAFGRAFGAAWEAACAKGYDYDECVGVAMVFASRQTSLV